MHCRLTSVLIIAQKRLKIPITKGERREKGRVGKSLGVGGLRWRKGRYKSREEDVFIKGAILGLARDLALEGIPGVHGDVPS